MAKYEIDMTYEAAGDDDGDETDTFRYNHETDLEQLELFKTKWESGEITAQYRGGPISGVKSHKIKNVVIRRG